MKIYFDCALKACDIATKGEFDAESLALKKHLKNKGFSILDFTSAESGAVTDLPETVDLVKEAEVIIAIGDSPSTGFSSIVKEICRSDETKVCVLFWKKQLSIEASDGEALLFSEDIRVWQYDDFEQIAMILEQISLELQERSAG